MTNQVSSAPASGRILSSIGIGTYLGHCDDDTDERMEECLRLALDGGVNLIDTAPNYRAERSEEVVGRAIAGWGGERARVAVATKVGFLPLHRNVPADPSAFLRQRFVDSGLLRPDFLHGHWQSFHPEYIRWQFTESLSRLKCSYVDIYYLHNPEELLRWFAIAVVERIIRQAMETVSELCQRGQIRHVGVSTWSGLLKRDGVRTLALTDLVRWAAAAGLSERFRFVQLPLSLGMPDALTVRTQRAEGKEWSAIRLARHLGLSVLTSAPLHQGKLLGISLPRELTAAVPQAANPAQLCLEFARSAPGVTASIVGVTSPEHIGDIMEVVARPRLSTEAYAQAFG